MSFLIPRKKRISNFLPTVAVAPTGVFATRKLLSSYSGALFRLVRIADSATLDIFANADGSPDVSGVEAWLGGATTAQVDIVYNQTGSGWNATQTSSGSRPRFALGNAIRGKHGVVHDFATVTNSFLTIDPLLTGNSRATTVTEVVSYASSVNSVSGMLGSTYNVAGVLNLFPGSGTLTTAKLRVLTSTAFQSVANAKSRSQPQISTYAAGASSILCYQDNLAAQSMTQSVAATWVGGRIGNIDSAGYQINGLFFCRIIYPAVLSPTDIASVHTYLASAYDTLTSYDTQIIWPGHSAVQGTKAVLLKNNQWNAEPLLKRRMMISNQGKFGQLAATMYSEVAQYTARFDGTLAYNVMVGICPANDISGVAAGSISGYGTTVWTSFVLPFIQAAKAAGFIVIQPTMLPLTFANNQAAREAERVAFNALVAANAGTEGYTIVDYVADPNMSTVNGTYYDVDGVHPNNAGYAVLGGLFAAAVNAVV